jgi:DNA-directed RNA polymerase subunit RPC12/RpoP
MCSNNKSKNLSFKDKIKYITLKEVEHGVLYFTCLCGKDYHIKLSEINKTPYIRCNQCNERLKKFKKLDDTEVEQLTEFLVTNIS